MQLTKFLKKPVKNYPKLGHVVVIIIPQGAVDIVDSFLCEKYCQRYYRCNQVAVVNDYWKVLDDEDVEELAGRYTGI